MAYEHEKDSCSYQLRTAKTSDEFVLDVCYYATFYVSHTRQQGHNLQSKKWY